MIPIQLWDLKGSFLIIPAPSGIVYSNQTGGISCCHPEQEGALVPFALTPAAIPHVGCYGGPLSDAEADELDAFFEATAPELRVDRARLTESMEAWVWVTCTYAGEGSEFRLLGSWSGSAILTWENCD